MKWLLAFLHCSCLAATNVLYSPKALEQVKSLQKRSLLIPISSLAAIVPVTTNVTFVILSNCGQDFPVIWGTNSGVYQWTNTVTAGTTNITLSILKGVRYYFATSTNCSTFGPEFVYPPFPPTNYYSIFAQTSTNVSGPFADISTNVLMRFTNNAPKDFFRLRIGVSQSP